MLALFVGAGSSRVPHDTVQRRGKRKPFFKQEKSPFGEITQAQPMISSNQCARRKKERVGVRKMGF